MGRVPGNAGEHVSQPSLRVHVVELRRHDQRGHDGGAVGAAFGAGEEPRLPSQRNLAVILPMSGRMSWSIIAGIRCTGGACVIFGANAAHQAISCTLSYRPVP